MTVGAATAYGAIEPALAEQRCVLIDGGLAAARSDQHAHDHEQHVLATRRRESRHAVATERDRELRWTRSR